MDRLTEERVKYEERHTTTGCKITHMIGVPLIVLSVPMLLFSRKKALAMFGLGWTLQFSGHVLFEKNSPLFLEHPLNPYTYITAILFMKDEWLKALCHLVLATRPSSTGEVADELPAPNQERRTA